MIYISDLQQLVNSWQGRVDSSIYPSSYKDGVMDCIYELNQLISKSIDEEIAYNEFLDSEADSYLSSIEAHEAA